MFLKITYRIKTRIVLKAGKIMVVEVHKSILVRLVIVMNINYFKETIKINFEQAPVFNLPLILFSVFSQIIGGFFLIQS